MTNKTKEKLFYLVELKSDEHVHKRDLFSSNEKAKDFIKKDLYLPLYDKSTKFWTHEDSYLYAEKITLICK